MDSNSEEMYLQNLEEYVLDEDKIVTYKWLSKTLNIHVNQAKQLLFVFCSSKDKQESVSATYLLAGRLRSSGEYLITVVGQDKYDDAKSSFDSITSEHVYSVQKSKETPSLSTLYIADSQPVEEKEDGTTSLGAIRCKDSVRRAAEELSLLRITVPPPAPLSNLVSKPAQQASSKDPEKTSPVKSKADEDKNGKETAAKNSKAKGGLASMFAAQTAKNSKPPAATAASTSKNNTKNKKAGGISNFFNKVSKDEYAESVREEKKDDAAKTKVNEEKMIVDDDSPSKTPSPPKKEKKCDPEPKRKAPSTASKDNKAKRSRIKDKKEDVKKRKRIVVQALESSDDEESQEEDKISSRESSPVPVLQAKALESDEEDEVIPPTPTPATESSNGRCRRKRKVTKDKTSMDEDGYIVTQKVTEYESYSESDTENTDAKKLKEKQSASSISTLKESASTSKVKNEKTKAPLKKASPTKGKSPLKSKQQSLMSFFKKK